MCIHLLACWYQLKRDHCCQLWLSKWIGEKHHLRLWNPEPCAAALQGMGTPGLSSLQGGAQGIRQGPHGCSDACSLAKKHWIHIRNKGNTFYLQLCVDKCWSTTTSLSYSTPFRVQVFCISTINTNIVPLLAAKCEKSKCRSQVVSNAAEFMFPKSFSWNHGCIPRPCCL